MSNAQKLTDFFKSAYWAEALKMLHNPDSHHVHVYINTSIEPRDLEKALIAYFETKGYKNERIIDHMAPRFGTGALHGIHLKGLPHFDIMFNYKKGVGIEPMDRMEGEMGSNLKAWGTEYMTEYYKNFQFRPFDAATKKDLEQYFASEHFAKGIEYVMDEENVHVHLNTETSIDPLIIKEYAEKALAKRGFELEEVTDCVFAAKGAYYQGKIVFLSKKPQRVFDISWKYNAKVTIVPTEDWIVFKEQKGHDVWTKTMLKESVLDKGVWEKLSPQDIEYVRKNV